MKKSKYISKGTYKYCFKEKNFNKMCNMLDYDYDNTNKSWDEFCKAYETITSIVESGKSLLKEAESKIMEG